MLVLWLFTLAIRAMLAGLEALRAVSPGPQAEPGDDQFCVMPERFLR